MSSQVGRAVIHASDERALLDEVCRILVEVGGYHLAMIAWREPPPSKQLEIVAHHGFEAGYADVVRLSWDATTPRGRGPGGCAFRTGEPCVGRDIETDPALAPWREDALRRGYRSLAAFPLSVGGERLGVLGVYAVETDAFDREEVDIIGELAANLAFGVDALRRLETQARAERRLATELRFAESLDQLDRALRGATRLDEMVGDMLETVLEILDCDRCFLQYPCDPDAPTWSIPMERTRPEFPGARADGAVFPMTEDVARGLRLLLAREAPVTFGPGNDEPRLPSVAARYGVRAYMSVIVRPRTGPPWQLGVQACSRDRVWTDAEVRLFHEMGRRVGDALTTMIALEELRESEVRRSRAESLAHLGYWEYDFDADRLDASAEACRIAGFDPAAPPAAPARWRERILTAREADAALARLLDAGSVSDVTLRLAHPDGDVRELVARADLTRDATGKPRRISGTLRDVTSERLGARERAAHLRLLEAMDRLNRAIQSADSVEAALSAALEVALEVFGCDRASLVEADFEQGTWRVSLQRARDGFAGDLPVGVDMPMTPEVAAIHRRSGADQVPYLFGPGTDLPLTPELNESGVAGNRALGMGLHPKGRTPWGFAVQQVGEEREWPPEDVRLFKEMGHRLTDGLTGLLTQRELREREVYLRTLVQTIPDLVWVKDPDGVYLNCNARFERFFGAPEAEIRGRTDYDFVDRELADFFRRHDRAAMAAGGPTVNEEWLEFAADGYRGLFETIKTPLRGADGRLVGVLGVARDITEHHEAEQELRIAATAFEAQEGIVITDADQVILRVNGAFTEITGYTAEEVVGRRPSVLSSGRHDEGFYRAMWAAIARDGYWQGEIWNRRKGGDTYPEWLTISAVTGPDGGVTHYVGTQVDITARKAAAEEIEHLAFHDGLTELPNRRLLLDRLQHALTACERSQRQGALFFIDLDGFKILNDTLGHEQGDRLLIEAAARLTRAVRAGDTVARLGDDEFVVIVENLSGTADEVASAAKTVAEKIRQALSAPYPLAGHRVRSTASIGVALFGGRQSSVEELLKQADIAMYQAKEAGRDNARFYDPATEAALSTHAAIQSELHLALEGAQLELFYQPQIHARHGIVGAEALLRWHHPERGLVTPGTFIGIAERTGLILPLGQWVLETACAQLAAWATSPALRGVRLAINVSARQFRQRDFVAQVRRALDSSGAPPQLLELELTESVVLDDVDDTIAKMRALRGIGVGFSMDDFGTGYSSLAYLTRLPLDQLKLDRSFVRHLPHRESDAVVAQSVVSLAHSLGLLVVAEGVETEAQRAFLEEHGCLIWQGYLFGRPAPIGAFEATWANG